MLNGVTAQIRPELCYAWRGPAAIVLERNGTAGDHPLTGFFFRQARFLRRLRLELNGESPYPCSLAQTHPQELELSYIHPEVEMGGGGGSGSGGLESKGDLLYRGLDLRVTYRVHPASVEVIVRLANRWQEQVSVELGWVMDADYASVDEAHFGLREQEAPVEAEAQEHGVRFDYRHPQLRFATNVCGDGAEWEWTGSALTTRISLPRQEVREVRLIVRAEDAELPIPPAEEERRETRLERWRGGITLLHAPGETPLVEITNVAMRDLGSLALLEGPDEEWLVPAAGMPLYQTLWGRDALTSTWQGGIFDRGEMLGDALTYLGRLQGTRVDPARDEEPGRIINQAKTDPLSRLGISPFDRYYADYASPLLFVIGVGYQYALTGSRDLAARHWPAAKRVLDWARRYGDRDGDGYLEYLTSSPKGPRHQGWKDSENAVVGDDGRQVDPPIAPCEIQGYYHSALQFMALLSFVMGEKREALDFWKEAGSLKERFNRDFWMEEEGCIAFGLDAEKRPIRAVTSNAGQCLATGIVSSDHIPRLVRRLFEPDMFSGWGIRTLSTGNPAYQPLDYHLGSVWPVENGTILFGLRRYGQDDRAVELARAMYDLARLWPAGRAPECVGGYGREEFGHPGAYPRANAPQTWNQTVFPLLVQSLLGLVPYAPLHLLMIDPILPPWLPELTVKDLRVGDATVNLRFTRSEDGKTEHEVVRKEGELKIVRQPWIESMSADWMERLHGLMGR